MDMRKTDPSVEGDELQPARTRIASSNQNGKMTVCVFIMIVVPRLWKIARIMSVLPLKNTSTVLRNLAQKCNRNK
ncbi:MAG: hypothetical protein F3745_03580 [Nitrospinae bacterium]|nr:hypothetical protein [Nitrospinota bacterium]